MFCVTHIASVVQMTARRAWTESRCSAKFRVEDINEAVRGWCGYFDQGTVAPTYRTLTRHLLWRIRRWLSKKHKRRGTGARQYPLEFLTQELGLYLPQVPNGDRLRAKA